MWKGIKENQEFTNGDYQIITICSSEVLSQNNHISRKFCLGVKPGDPKTVDNDGQLSFAGLITPAH